jgi:hypothetical protein
LFSRQGVTASPSGQPLDSTDGGATPAIVVATLQRGVLLDAHDLMIV